MTTSDRAGNEDRLWAGNGWAPALRSGAEVAAAPGLDWHQIADDIEGAAHEALSGNAVQDRWFHHEVARIRSDAARLTAKP